MGCKPSVSIGGFIPWGKVSPPPHLPPIEEFYPVASFVLKITHFAPGTFCNFALGLLQMFPTAYQEPGIKVLGKGPLKYLYFFSGVQGDLAGCHQIQNE